MGFSIWACSISNTQFDEAEKVAFAGFEKALRSDDVTNLTLLHKTGKAVILFLILSPSFNLHI